MGPAFLKNMTLWWGCPAVLAELTVKTGSLGIAVKLCAYGLIAVLVTAGAGYVLGNYFWPNFYFEPVQTGKNLWLGMQGLSIAVYVVGVLYAVAGIRRASVYLR